MRHSIFYATTITLICYASTNTFAEPATTVPPPKEASHTDQKTTSKPLADLPHSPYEGTKNAALEGAQLHSNPVGNPFEMKILFNIDPEIGGIVWNSQADAPWVPFYARLGIGAMFSFFDFFIELNAVGTLGMNWGIGLQTVFNNNSTGLWAQTTIEMGPHAYVTASVGLGWLFTGIQYQQTFSDGFRGPKAVVVYLRFPFGILWMD